jgi:hypothetical protein
MNSHYPQGFNPMNTPRPNMFGPNHMDEEELRRQRLIQARKMAPSVPVSLAAGGGDDNPSNPWGENKTCMGLKILCGGLGLIIVILIIVLIIKMVHKAPAQTSAASPGDSQLPMSLAGGFDPMGESLLSTE